jgi:IS30 family transposase
MEVKKHRRLTLKERIIIETLLKENNTKAYASKRLGRAGSTISREVNQWTQNDKGNYACTFIALVC